MSTTSAFDPPRRSTFVDKELRAANGYVMIAIGLVVIVVCAWLIYGAYDKDGYAHAGPWFVLPAIVVAIAVAKGLVILQPNESVVCLLFGSYVGTEHRPGLWWVNPFNSKTKISRQLETLEAGPLKVNDAAGNPIDIGAVVAARRMVVKGAVSIVEDALKELDKKNLADALDPERKAAMISNLLVVLVGDREVSPVINTGTLYS